MLGNSVDEDPRPLYSSHQWALHNSAEVRMIHVAAGKMAGYFTKWMTYVPTTLPSYRYFFWQDKAMAKSKAGTGPLDQVRAWSTFGAYCSKTLDRA